MNFTKLICGLSVLSALACSAADFFDLPAEDPGAKLPADKIYPLGRKIPILVYAPRSLEKIKADGFTVAGPTYAKDKDKWAKLFEGYPIIWTVIVRQNGVICDKDFFTSKKNALDPAAIEADVKQSVTAALKKYPNIAFWYMVPEERRWWKKREFEFLRIVYRAIRKADPSGRPVWMYLPGHYGADSVAKYNDRMDVMGKGTYTNYSGFKDQRVWVRYSTEIMLDAAKKSGRKMLAMPALEMMRSPEDDELGKVSDWARHDVYCAMIAGAHGFSIFSLWKRPNLRKAYNNYYDAYSRASKELSGKDGLGEIFLFGERCRDLNFAVTDGPAEIELKQRKKADTEKGFAGRKYPPVSLADIRHVRGRFCFLVNSANVPVKGTLRGFPQKRIKVLDAVSGQSVGTADGGELKLDFQPLEVKLLKFEKP
ncbi:MAG: hypothetical protein IJS14_11195 [Lentisphaeria bacterium]|nr:hypothetical protein [Lentisphaeria bacterium]